MQCKPLFVKSQDKKKILCLIDYLGKEAGFLLLIAECKTGLGYSIENACWGKFSRESIYVHKKNIRKNGNHLQTT